MKSGNFNFLERSGSLQPVTGLLYLREWRKLHNEKLRDLYSLPNIVRVVKSRRMRWAGHVAGMGEGEVCTGF